MDKTIHFLVSGRVQGVFFRAATKRCADRFGLTGWVKNRPDGRVEGVATGQDEKVDEFLQWLKRGPELAKVSELEIIEIELKNFSDFKIS